MELFNDPSLRLFFHIFHAPLSLLPVRTRRGQPHALMHGAGIGPGMPASRNH
jgi:hypothetical protein